MEVTCIMGDVVTGKQTLQPRSGGPDLERVKRTDHFCPRVVLRENDPSGFYSFLLFVSFFFSF